MARNYLKGNAGDEANVILATAAYNLSKLVAWFYCALEIWGAFQNKSELSHQNRSSTPNYT